MCAVSVLDANADTQRSMVIGVAIEWKAHASESSKNKYETPLGFTCIRSFFRQFQMSIGTVAMLGPDLSKL